jgi:hypothetical protein
MTDRQPTWIDRLLGRTSEPVGPPEKSEGDAFREKDFEGDMEDELARSGQWPDQRGAEGVDATRKAETPLDQDANVTDEGDMGEWVAVDAKSVLGPAYTAARARAAVKSVTEETTAEPSLLERISRRERPNRHL